MIEVEHLSNKFSRLYRTVDDIEHLIIRIRLINDDTEKEDIAVFKWQQKRFSPYEKEFYKDLGNCFTDLEKEYHEAVIKETQQDSDSIIFSYTERDEYHPKEKLLKTLKNRQTKPNHLVELMSANIIQTKHDTHDNNESEESDNESESSKQPSPKNKTIKKFTTNVGEIDREYDFLDSLYQSSKNMIIEPRYNVENYETMHIMVDFGEYYQNTWIKSEQVLCTIKYNPSEKILRITPDFTLFEPYIFKVTTDETRIYHYFIENASLDGISSKELLREIDILNQMKFSDKTKSKLAIEWLERPSGINVHIFLEIQSAWNFQYDNVFIRYYIDLKNSWTLLDTQETFLTGVTYTNSRSRNQNDRMHFGFPIDFTITSKFGRHVHEDPVVYFELISKDTWSRFRCEGLTYMVLPIWLPGLRTDTLSCYRITSENSVRSELRRFFIGDCSNFQNLTAISAGNERSMNRLATQTISTGYLRVRSSIIHVVDTSEGADKKSKWEYLREMRLRDKLYDPQLARTVEEVVEAFRKAKAAMLEARNAV